MSVRQIKSNNAYGLVNAIQNLTPQPIIAQRAPTVRDRAELGTLWINETTNAYYIATSIASGSTTWQAQQTGAGVFAAVTTNQLDVTGPTTLTGAVGITGATTVTGDLAVTGNVAVTGDFDITDTESVSITSTKDAAKAIYLHANGGVAETVEIHSDLGTGLNSINILSDVGGVLVTATAKADNKAINLVSSAGGFQLDGVLTSALNVVGASEDIQLNATGGSIALTATEAAVDAIALIASDVAGKVAITGAGGVTVTTTNTALDVATGTGAINLGTDAVAKTITIGNVTTTTGVVINSGTSGIAMASTGAGDISIASSDTVLIDSAGVLELNSSAGIISIGNDAVAQNINVGTGAAARVITIGNNTTTTGLALTAGTGDIVATSADAVTVDAVGVLELNSSGAAIGIGNDADNFAVNVGTAGARTVTIGSSTGASSTVIDTGTGACNIGTSATAHATAVGSTTAACTLALNTPAGTPVVAANGISVTTATAGITLPGAILISTGAGAPAGALATAIGCLYIRTDAGAAAERVYVATGVGAWTNLSAAA